MSEYKSLLGPDLLYFNVMSHVKKEISLEEKSKAIKNLIEQVIKEDNDNTISITVDFSNIRDILGSKLAIEIRDSVKELLDIFIDTEIQEVISEKTDVSIPIKISIKGVNKS